MGKTKHNRRFMLLAPLALIIPAQASAKNALFYDRIFSPKPDPKIEAWKKTLPAIEREVSASHPRYQYVKAVNKGWKIHLISGGEFDVDYHNRLLNIRLIPIMDPDGNIADSVSARVYRKTGWGNTKTVMDFTGSADLEAKGRRSYRINRFSAACVVLWDKEVVEDDSNYMAQGCHPPPQSYEEALARKC